MVEMAIRFSKEDIIQRQSLPLDIKILWTQKIIRDYYNSFDGDVAVSYSGGKDSLVLLHIARQLYPDMKAVFFNTGNEWSEIISFVKQTDNVEIVKPKISLKTIIENWGYPVISKEVSQKIYECRNTPSQRLKDIRLYGDDKGNGKIPKKYLPLLEAPFSISDRCCHYLKKQPSKNYEKHTKLFTGERVEESRLRFTAYMKQGCTSYGKNSFCKPLSTWLSRDIDDYIEINKLKLCSLYQEGFERTGCMYCLFGYTQGYTNNIEVLKLKQPKLYKYAIDTLGFGKVIEYLDKMYPRK